jgi:hypothetical protein
VLASFREIIAWWPTMKALSDDLDVPDVLPRQWKARDLIPATHWEALLETKVARKHRLTAMQLIKLAARRRIQLGPW